MSAVTFAVVTVLVFAVIHLVHYVAHRWLVHRPIVAAFYEAHALGHHRVYTVREYVSPAFIGFNKTLLADWLIGSVLLLSAYLACPLEVFVLIAVEGLLMVGAIAVIHRAFHIESHFLKRLPVLREYDRLHVEHHRNVQRNYGILFHGFDRLFGSFVDGRRGA